MCQFLSWMRFVDTYHECFWRDGRIYVLRLPIFVHMVAAQCTESSKFPDSTVVIDGYVLIRHLFIEQIPGIHARAESAPIIGLSLLLHPLQVLFVLSFLDRVSDAIFLRCGR